MTPILAALAALAAAPAAAAEKDTMVYEMRVYYATPGKFKAMNDRFRDHTVKLFEKHGMVNVGYWVPAENPDSVMIYLLGHKSRDAATASWKAFIADPDWQAAHKESEKDGKLVTKIESYYLSATDYSPPVKAEKAAADRVFELRTYIASPKNLDNLNARFRNHTVKLFEKHGMTNVGYFTMEAGDKTTCGKLLSGLSPKGTDKADVPAEDPAGPVALVYLLAHKSKEARDVSFEAFRKDPVWTAARDESEKAAGGSLTAKDGVKSLLLKPTDYSPTK